MTHNTTHRVRKKVTSHKLSNSFYSSLFLPACLHLLLSATSFRIISDRLYLSLLTICSFLLASRLFFFFSYLHLHLQGHLSRASTVGDFYLCPFISLTKSSKQTPLHGNSGEETPIFTRTHVRKSGHRHILLTSCLATVYFFLLGEFVYFVHRKNQSTESSDDENMQNNSKLRLHRFI